MSAPFTLAEELAPVLQQIVALDIFLRCAKEEQDIILADQGRLQREIYANCKTSEVILSRLSPEFIPKKLARQSTKSTRSSQALGLDSSALKIYSSRKRKAEVDEEQSSSNRPWYQTIGTLKGIRRSRHRRSAEGNEPTRKERAILWLRNAFVFAFTNVYRYTTIYQILYMGMSSSVPAGATFWAEIVGLIPRCTIIGSAPYKEQDVEDAIHLRPRDSEKHLIIITRLTWHSTPAFLFGTLSGYLSVYLATGPLQCDKSKACIVLDHMVYIHSVQFTLHHSRALPAKTTEDLDRGIQVISAYL
ncbi:hypothetical protein EV421DRAFT_1742983 [Armillaria borealis]|uniref:Uncharacterized protein n=1 Tax=Armillaria borealis TaxID=47425 RepID=A0AA39IYK6_9AGAR|nr:hypothetical protein EV421DRAFT_1742983 [Armillaria borealis]